MKPSAGVEPATPSLPLPGRCDGTQNGPRSARGDFSPRRRTGEPRECLGTPRVSGQEHLGDGEAPLSIDGEDDLEDELESHAALGLTPTPHLAARPDARPGGLDPVRLASEAIDGFPG